LGFKILMSHRPDAFDYAASQGINLTLAGHTHGGQIGFMGRSLFDSYWADRYLWGEYRQGRSALYTSSGVGHWFPFRLGCPPEAPIIELRRA
jgi:predicted MPP superfamily phosphohydrolase